MSDSFQSIKGHDCGAYFPQLLVRNVRKDVIKYYIIQNWSFSEREMFIRRQSQKTDPVLQIRLDSHWVT